MYGQLDAGGTNAILVSHAQTGDARPYEPEYSKYGGPTGVVRRRIIWFCRSFGAGHLSRQG